MLSTRGCVDLLKGFGKMNIVKKAAWSALLVHCVVRVYRGPDVRQWVDDGRETLRPKTIGECVAGAIIEGSMLAEGITNGLKTVWK